MDYTKLLQDYINESPIYPYNDYRVLSWKESKNEIIVLIADDTSLITVSLFDLISFVYGKI